DRTRAAGRDPGTGPRRHRRGSQQAALAVSASRGEKAAQAAEGSPESKRSTWRTLSDWVVCLAIGAGVTWAMSAALVWGGLSMMLVAFALPMAATWILLPPARTHLWWRWLAVLF